MQCVDKFSNKNLYEPYESEPKLVETKIDEIEPHMSEKVFLTDQSLHAYPKKMENHSVQSPYAEWAH